VAMNADDSSNTYVTG